MSDLEPGVPLPVAAFIRSAIGEGMGVTAARQAMREGGIGRMSNETFGQLYGQIRDAVGMRSAIAGMDYAALPGAELYTEWAAGAAGRHASFVDVYVRPIGQGELTSKWYQHVTDAPHTPAEAIAAAIQNIQGGAETGRTPSGEVIEGAAVTSITRTIGHAA